MEQGLPVIALQRYHAAQNGLLLGHMRVRIHGGEPYMLARDTESCYKKGRQGGVSSPLPKLWPAYDAPDLCCV